MPSRPLRNAAIGVAAIAAAWWILGGLASARRDPPVVTLPGAHVIYFTTRQTFRSYADACGPSGLAGYDVRRLASFDVTPDAIVLKAGKRLLEMRRPHRGTWDQPLETRLIYEGMGENDEVVTDSSGVVLVVDTSNGRLRQLSDRGSLEDVVGALLSPQVPGPFGAAASTRAGSAYLHGSRHIFALSDSDGSAQLETTFDEPSVEAVSEAADGLYILLRSRGIARQSEIVERRPDGLHAAIRLEEIVSIAAPDDARVLFFATEDAVFALVGTVAVPVTRHLTGRLRWRDGILFVLDCHGTFVGIEHLMAALALDPGESGL